VSSEEGREKSEERKEKREERREKIEGAGIFCEER